MKTSVFRKIMTIICSISLVLLLAFSCSLSLHASISTTPRLNVKNLSLTKNNSFIIRTYNCRIGQKISYKSNNSNVVQIKRSSAYICIIKAKATGTATITATIKDSVNNTSTKLKCKVTVSPPAVSIKFAKKSCKLEEGTTSKQIVTIKPNISCEKPVFTSENENIAIMSSSGIITAISPGKTIIHATLSNGKESTLRVTVKSSTSKPTEVPPLKTIAPSPSAQPTKAPTPTAGPSVSPVPPTSSPIAEHAESGSVNKSKKR